ncbi:hypothetical protein [Sphingobacterium kitahiroshimense]|uniref:hypothetical protein n=1 Tax=Sphingobacterium kitahiroshimense TaxID=470446 RepID=UPI0032098DB3
MERHEDALVMFEISFIDEYVQNIEKFQINNLAVVQNHSTDNVEKEINIEEPIFL